jgi:hypothetical protein
MSELFTVDSYGRLIRRGVDPDEVAAMSSPVECGYCGRVYDVGTVTVTARYADCSVWKSPCCKRTVDDRPPWPGSRPGIRRLNHDGTYR